MKQDIFPKVVLLAAIAIFISIFLFARVIISISFIIVILLCFFNKDVLTILKQNISLKFLLFAAFLINLGFGYAAFFRNDQIIHQFFGFSNPLLIVLYILSASYFLSKNKKYPDYLLNIFVYIVVFISFIALFRFSYKYLMGDYFIISDFYTEIDGGSTIQSIVALTFPFAAVFIVGKAIHKQSKLLKLVMIFVGILIVFIDLFVNRSKAGYIIEFVVLIYYFFVIIKHYSLNDEKELNILKFFSIILICIISLSAILFTVYKTSNIFHDRVNEAIKESQLYFSKDFDNKTAEELALTSTGLRLMYYDSAIKVFEKYPKLLLLGCSPVTNISDVAECTSFLINKNDVLKNDPHITKEGIMPHNEFINYTFKGGILAGLSLLIFFIMLLYEARGLDYRDKVYFRVLIIAMFIGCLFDYFFTVQILVILFSTLLAIFFAKLKIKQG
ncbi:O-antigen ligase family protein [Francisella tularensis]|uniref:Hypothetical membrane protein n=8 Tax=Francisella tularensis TaxID=263 RepID=A0AAI8BIL7_FRATH|nr:O-antigen ligase family protein [Francisella tularensis]AHH46198.1 membrane protein [Francisella tularensis subsp. holarctica PHIT-FT049]EBA52333.1 hypothetical membrane protein [Francisella tularensis subsp. holarctica 257]AJI50480.1 O-antigen ligase like membrane family protein [Francisella tularensis subsp. holarctica]AJI59536.1 O-antigen ligase like membrane family protein [Francisella tularensis subsp. holarctica LVS]AJI65760.1 O-antigen ligase like membrane family protein [Francisella